MFRVGQPGQHAFHALARTAFRGIFRLTARVHVAHLATIPSRGPLILAPNHISHFDPPAVGSFFTRHVDWMAMEELFRHPGFARALALTGAFPVHRDGTDRTALRTAARRLREGRCVGVFPEGGIRAGETSILNGAPMRPGVAALAQLAEAPILPVVVLGTDRLYLRGNWKLRRPPVWILSGTPIPPTDSRDAISAALAAAYPALQADAIARWNLSPSDLPQTPAHRKGEDPYAP